MANNSAYDLLVKNKKENRFPNRNKRHTAGSAKEAGIALIYRPKDPDEKAVMVNGIRVTQEGVRSIGPHPQLQKWVNKALRVEVQVEKTKDSKSPSKSTSVSPKPTNQNTSNASNGSNQVPSAYDVILEKRKKEAEMLNIVPDSNNASPVQPVESGKAPEGQVEEAASEPDLGNIDEPEVYTDSQIRERFEGLKELKEFSKQHDLTDRSYDGLLDKLKEAGHVVEDPQKRDER